MSDTFTRVVFKLRPKDLKSSVNRRIDMSCSRAEVAVWTVEAANEHVGGCCAVT